MVVSEVLPRKLLPGTFSRPWCTVCPVCPTHSLGIDERDVVFLTIGLKENRERVEVYYDH